MARKGEASLRVARDEVGKREKGRFCRADSQGKTLDFILSVTGSHHRAEAIEVLMQFFKFLPSM